MKKLLFFSGLIAVLTATTLFLKADPVVKIGSGSTETVLAGVKKVQFTLDGKNITPPGGQLSDGAVSLPDALDYNGVIYVPLRFAAKALKASIRWDQATQTVALESTAVADAAYLSDASPSLSASLLHGEAVILNNAHPNPPSGPDAYWEPPMRINDKTYGRGISFQLFNGDHAALTWRLDGKYSNLDATLGLDVQTHSYSSAEQEAYQHTVATVVFTGDNRTLASIEIGPSTTPSRVTVPLSGVRNLTVEVRMRTDPNNLAMLDMVDPALR